MRRFLIDECIHPQLAERLRSRFPDFAVTTVRDMGWAGSADQSIVKLIQGCFEVFVTLDRGFEFQHNLRKMDFGVIILRAKNNQMTSYDRLLDDLAIALFEVQPGTVIHVSDPQLS